MEGKKLDILDTIVPQTAIAVKITNVSTPYFIRVCEIKDYEERFNCISKKLLLLLKKGIFSTDKKSTEPKIGDAIITCDGFGNNVELPAWLCRGNICHITDGNEKIYTAFLTDCGTCIQLKKDDFVTCSTDLISEEYLSFTAGLYNVLPVTTNCDSLVQKETTVLVSEEWSKLAIQYTKELINTSSAIYFDHLVSDEHGKHYGEFYLTFEDTIIRLSEAVVLNNYAIYLHSDLLKFMKHAKNDEIIKKEVMNDETIFYVNISKLCKISNQSEKQQERYMKKRNRIQTGKHFNTELVKEMEKVLIYGEAKYECLTAVLDARFPTGVHTAWKSLVQSSRPRKLQSYIWPAIKNGADVIAIGAAKSGKTFGCVFAVCGLVATIPKFPGGVSPSALILCSSSSEVLEVHSLCTEFLQSYGTIKSVAAFNGKSERTLVAEMFNGCQILISTPRFLVRFMNQNRQLLNFENLQYLILDDADIILDKYFDSISMLFKKHKVICNRELNHKSILLQIIITAKTWTTHIKRIASLLMSKLYICITSFIEAAIFKSIRPKVYIMNSNSKSKKTLDLVSDKYSTSRTAIICTHREEAEALHELLQKYKDTLLAHENMNLIQLKGIKQCWDACVYGSYPILICTDEVLSEMGFTNVSWLIHYSISLRTKTQFNFRFSTLFDNLQMEKCNCDITIMADETNDIQFLSIIKIMQRMNVLISQTMLETIERITATLEKRKDNYPICGNIKLWGFCHKKDFCAFRHRINSKDDVPISNIQINDKVKFTVIRIHNVTHISARIVSYIKCDTLEEIEFSSTELMQLFMKMQEFYSSIQNRIKCEIISVGSICGLEEPVDSYKRVQILHVKNDEKTDTPKFVDVKCIDNGVILKKVNAYRLLHLPEEFMKYSTHVVEVFLVGVTPHDEEYVWNYCATDAVDQWYKKNVDERSYLIGTVNLHLGNMIWVDTLQVGTKLIGYEDVIGACLKKELLNNDHAVENDKHLSQLYQLCKDAGFSEINGYNLNVLLNKV